MKVIKNSSGWYFVQGAGFGARTAAAATKFEDKDTPGTQECIQACGLGSTVAEEWVVASDPNIKQNASGISFAVSYVRKKQLRSDGSINTHRLNPSPRRFATYDEAVHHGGRFVSIEKHLGFYVTESRDPVNAYVNKVTGKTNPEIGRKRTNR